jgi:hypothetical protein
MKLVVTIALLWAGAFSAMVLAAALSVVYYDIACPLIDRRRSRITSTDSTIFVEDPFPVHRYGDPMRVIGGAGAGSTTALLDDEEAR